jgi:hypothetical protein
MRSRSNLRTSLILRPMGQNFGHKEISTRGGFRASSRSTTNTASGSGSAARSSEPLVENLREGRTDSARNPATTIMLSFSRQSMELLNTLHSTFVGGFAERVIFTGYQGYAPKVVFLNSSDPNTAASCKYATGNRCRLDLQIRGRTALHAGRSS